MHHETAERLRTALQRRGMKPVELAEQTGIPRSAISQYLAGKYVPKQDKLYLLSRALRVEVLWLMGLSEQMNPENKKSSNTGNDKLEETGESYHGGEGGQQRGRVMEFTVEDNDMACSGILKGDRVSIEKGPVEPGGIAAVSERGTIYLRRVYSVGGQIFLKADCPGAVSVPYEKNHKKIKIIGKAVQCCRDIR